VIVMEQDGSVAEHLVDCTRTVASSTVAIAIATATATATGVGRVEFSGHDLVEALVDAVEEIRPHLGVGRNHRHRHRHRRTCSIYSTNSSTSTSSRRHLPSRASWSRAGICLRHILQFCIWNVCFVLPASTTDRELVEELVHGNIGFQQGARSPKDSCRELLGMGQPHHRLAVTAHGGEDPALEEVEVFV